MDDLAVGLLIIVVVALAALYQRSLREAHTPGDDEERPPLWW